MVCIKSLKMFGSEEQTAGTGNPSPLSIPFPLAPVSLHAFPLLLAKETSTIRWPENRAGERRMS